MMLPRHERVILMVLVTVSVVGMAGLYVAEALGLFGY